MTMRRLSSGVSYDEGLIETGKIDLRRLEQEYQARLGWFRAAFAAKLMMAGIVEPNEPQASWQMFYDESPDEEPLRLFLPNHELDKVPCISNYLGRFVLMIQDRRGVSEGNNSGDPDIRIISNEILLDNQLEPYCFAQDIHIGAGAQLPGYSIGYSSLRNEANTTGGTDRKDSADNLAGATRFQLNDTGLSIQEGARSISGSSSDSPISYLSVNAAANAERPESLILGLSLLEEASELLDSVIDQNPVFCSDRLIVD